MLMGSQAREIWRQHLLLEDRGRPTYNWTHMKTALTTKKGQRAVRAGRRTRIATIGGVRVALQRVHGKGRLPAALIKRIIREVNADRAAARQA